MDHSKMGRFFHQGRPEYDAADRENDRVAVAEQVATDEPVEAVFRALEVSEFNSRGRLGFTPERIVFDGRGVTSFPWENVWSVRLSSGTTQPEGNKGELDDKGMSWSWLGLAVLLVSVVIGLALSTASGALGDIGGLASSVVSLSGVAILGYGVVLRFRAWLMDEPEPVEYVSLHVTLTDTETTVETTVDAFEAKSEASEQKRTLEFRAWPHTVPDDIEATISRLQKA